MYEIVSHEVKVNNSGYNMENSSNKHTLLIVDDTPQNIDVLRGILKGSYKVKVATDGEKAIKVAFSKNKPDLILLDIMMPGMDGYEVCRQLKANEETKDIPIIFVTAKNEVEDESKGFDLGAADYITKPVSPILVKKRVLSQLIVSQKKQQLESQVKERTKELEETRLQIIYRLGRAAEFKDNETGMHVLRMSRYSEVLARAVGLDEAQVELILTAAPMHDIGKIGIPDGILLKPAKLSEDEWKVMQTHPAIGAEILGEHSSPILTLASEIAITHHEKWNGKGYPNGLKGDEIPLSGRIVAIADVFDALTTARPYKTAWPVDKAIALLEEEAGEHFDPELVPIFVKVMPEILALREKYAESESE